jgi:hypothetical protein
MVNNYIVFGMARSGHHAIVNWMGNQLPGKITHYNNCTKELEDHKFVTSSHAPIEYCNPGNSEYNMYTMEHFDLDLIDKFKMMTIVEDPTCIIILRDLLNWVASSILQINWDTRRLDVNADSIYEHSTDDQGRHYNTTIEIFKDHIREAMNITNRLDNKLVIGYNHWTQDIKYRKYLADRLEMPFTDKGFKEVAQFGNRSSFDGNNYRYSADKMDTLYRYKHLNNDIIERIMSDKELVELSILSKDITGPIPWLKDVK